MKPMKRIAMPAIVIAALALSACGGGGGGGGGMMAAMPEEPAAAPVQAPETEPGGEPETDPVAEPAPAREPEPEPLPDPVTLLRSHDRLGLADGFTAIKADEAMFVLANMPYRAGQAGGRAAADADIFLRAAVARYELRRTEAYRADHAATTFVRYEEVASVNPEVTTRVVRYAGQTPYASRPGEYVDLCSPSRGECVVPHPASPGVSDGEGRPVKTPIEDMPFVSNAMREYSEGVRTRNGVNLRYWSSGERAVPWAGWKVDTATDTWSGYGAWNEWSGFGLVMLSHNHQWDLYDSAWNYAIAGGDLTGSRPSPEMAGTYRGAAVARANDLSFIADGSVEMTVRLGANPSLDISFGDWQGYNLTETGAIGRPVSVPANYAATLGTLNQSGVQITSEGTFRLGSGEGAFYGPGGVEAAGVFRYNGVRSPGIHGAFGARKQDDPQ